VVCVGESLVLVKDLARGSGGRLEHGGAENSGDAKRGDAEGRFK
jgi:hypothetical protein